MTTVVSMKKTGKMTIVNIMAANKKKIMANKNDAGTTVVATIGATVIVETGTAQVTTAIADVMTVTTTKKNAEENVALAFSDVSDKIGG